MQIGINLHCELPLSTSIPSSNQSESSNDFGAILEAARRGASLTDAQIYAWEMHKKYTQAEDGPDEVEKVGMLKGFKMEFPSGFPSDLRQKLEDMYNDPKTDRWNFTMMYRLTFDPSLQADGLGWDNSWRQRLQSTIQADERAMGSFSPIARKNSEEMNLLSRKLIG